MFLKKSPIDLELAKNLRIARAQSGVTQHELGELVGLTFQQIQKYESGSNKIPASRLYEICRVLNWPISKFFEEVPIDSDYYNFEGASEEDMLENYKARNRELNALVKAFYKISDEDVRLDIISLVNSIAKKINV